MLREVALTGDFSADPRVKEFQNLYVYLTPFIDHLDQAGPATTLPRGYPHLMGGNAKYRVVLQCKVQANVIQEMQDPSPFFNTRTRELML